MRLPGQATGALACGSGFPKGKATQLSTGCRYRTTSASDPVRPNFHIRIQSSGRWYWKTGEGKKCQPRQSEVLADLPITVPECHIFSGIAPRWFAISGSSSSCGLGIIFLQGLGSGCTAHNSEFPCSETVQASSDSSITGSCGSRMFVACLFVKVLPA